jgi:hypothetical protein
MAFSEPRAFKTRFLTGQERCARLLETFRVAVVLAVLALAITASAASAPLPPGWSHAQVNVLIKHKAHTLIYDRGIVTRTARASLTLKEGDGSVVVIRIAKSAAVTLDGLPVPFAQLRRGEFAQTVRVDGAPAQQVTADRVAPTG